MTPYQAVGLGFVGLCAVAFVVDVALERRRNWRRADRALPPDLDRSAAHWVAAASDTPAREGRTVSRPDQAPTVIPPEPMGEEFAYSAVRDGQGAVVLLAVAELVPVALAPLTCEDLN